MIKSLLLTTILVTSCFINDAQSKEQEAVDLSLSTMVLFATDENPDLLMARSRQEQMEFFVGEGEAGYYPQISFNAEGGREYIERGNPRSNNLGKTSVTLNQKLFNGYAIESEVNRRKELVTTAGLDIDIQKENLIKEVMEYYLDILSAQNELKATREFVVEVDKIVKTISEMFEAGAVGKAMLDYARSRQASAYVDLNQAESSLNDGVSSLEFLTGPLPPFKAIRPDQFHPNNIDKSLYVARASVENSFMKKNQVEIDAMQHQLRAERGAYYPSLEFNVKAEQTHDDGGDVGRGRSLKSTVNLTYDIFDGYNTKNKVGRVSGQIKELEYRDDKIFKELKKDIDLAYNQVTSIQNSIRSTNKEIRANKALQSLNRENFKLGSINVIELIESEERLKAAYERKYQLERELYETTYTLLLTTAIINESYFCGSCSINGSES